jgi:hypothetical protein
MVVLAVCPEARGFDLDSVVVRHVQEVLKARGDYRGPVDGRLGPKTREAIRAFQRKAGLPVNGAPDAETLSRLDQPPQMLPAKPEAEAAVPPPIGPQPDGEPAPQESHDSVPAQPLAPIPRSQIPKLSPALALLFFGWLMWSRRRRRKKAAASAPPGPDASALALTTTAPSAADEGPKISSSGASSDVPLQPDPSPVLAELQAENNRRVRAAIAERQTQTAAPSGNTTQPPAKPRISVPMASREVPLMAAVVPAASPAPPAAAMNSAVAASSPVEHPDEAPDWSNLGIGRPEKPAPIEKPIATWIPKDKVSRISGMIIEGGLIYIGTRLPRLDGFSGDDRCLIRPRLPVRQPDSPQLVPRLPYYPAYAELLPEQRWIYLDWLARGRSDPAAEIGLVFLYFYGLERRLVGEKSETDRADLVAEVGRLQEIYCGNPSFARYSAELLAAVRVLAGEIPVQPPPAPEWPLRYPLGLPPDLRIGLSRAVVRSGILSGEWLLIWLLSDQQTGWRTPAKRADREFRQLFLRRFDQHYPQGIKVTAPRQSISLYYRSASGMFSVSLVSEADGVPDLSALRAPLDRGREIADRCMSDLEPLSRFLGRYPDQRDSLEAWMLLPPELKHPGSEAVQAFRSWIGATVTEPAALVPLAELLRRTEGTVPDKPGRRDLQKLGVKLAAFGFGLEPDPAFGARLPRADEAVALFRLGDSPATGPSPAWQSAVLTLALAVTVAHADGRVVAQEQELLHTHVGDAEGLADGERRRLAAHLRWLLAHPPGLGTLKARTADLPLQARQQIGRLAIAVTVADGVIHPAEVVLLSKLYPALGLDPDGIYSELHAFGSAPAETPASLLPAGSSGLAPPDAAPPIRLDLDRIHRIRADTARVSAVLSTVFAEESLPEPEPAAVATPEPAENEAAAERFPGLEPCHGALLRELAVAERWPRGDYERLARSLELMPEGAMEVINDWAFGCFDEAVLEDDDPILINLSLLSPPPPGAVPHA